jgi:serine phosphatase RsbU (regulator of sigma subunit)
MINVPLKVLLVEDSDDDAELLRMMIRTTGFSLVRAEKLSVALQRLSETKFDVVLLDLTLPDSLGFATFSRVHALTPHVPIIVLTGLEDETLGLRTVQEGAQDYLVKGDASPALLVRSLRYAVERKRAEELTARVLEELRVKNAEMQDDLRLAREVQEAFLPQHYPAFPMLSATGGSLRFSHRYWPAGIVGGDLFDVSRLSSDLAGVLICDVMGHGVRAALVTGMLRALIGEHPPCAAHPGKLLSQLNRGLRTILKTTDTPMFVSAFYLVINAVTGELAYANAGHPSPFRVHAHSSEVDPIQSALEPRGPVLGLFDEADYPTRHCRLDHGDRVLCFTDGVYEIDGCNGGESYGQTRLRAAVAQRADLPREEFLDALLAELHTFSGSLKFADDACLLAMDFKRPLETVHP